jgi:hypothetical protein
MALLDDEQRRKLNQFGNYMADFSARMNKAGQWRPTPQSGGLFGNIGTAISYANQQQQAREQQRLANEYQRMQKQQLQNEMERRKRLAQAQQNMLNPGQSQAVQTAALQQGGGPTKEAAAMTQRAQRGGLFGDLTEQQRGLLASMPPEQFMQVATDRVFAEPETRKSVRVVSGDSEVGRELGIPPGQNAEVQFENGRPVDVNSFGGGGQTINVGGNEPSPFQKGVMEEDVKQRSKIITRGNQAITTSRAADRMANLMASQNLNTGQLQPVLTDLKGIAKDVSDTFGVDTSNIMNMENLGSAQEFERNAKDLAMGALEGFEGSTSERELQFAQDQVARLGKDEDGNIRALAAMKAAADIARENAARAQSITTRDAWSEFNSTRLRRGPERIKELTEQYEQRLRERMKQNQGGGGQSAPRRDESTGQDRPRRKHDLSPDQIMDMDITEIPPVNELTPAQRGALDKRLQKEGY